MRLRRFPLVLVVLAAFACTAAAFDFLDRAEAPLGYGREGSGRGFEHLLRRSEMTRRLEQAWQASLPVGLRLRFQRHIQAPSRLFMTRFTITPSTFGGHVPV